METIILGENTLIEDGVEIDVREELVLGHDSLIRKGCILRGRSIHAGHHFYMNHNAEIGGGSCFEKTSSLDIGDYFHLGAYAQVNTAMPVKIGNEVGIGRLSSIYTHGAYLSELDGFPVKFAPVTIGDHVWIPNATIMPGVTIGDNVVIGAMSLVTEDIPSGSLAYGIPARVVKEHAFPKPVDALKRQRIIEGILQGETDETRRSELLRRHGIRNP